MSNTKKQIKLSKADEKLLAELQVGKNPEIVEGIELSPLAVALFDFIKGSEYLIHKGNHDLIMEFDRARDLFRKMYPDEYMALLD